MAGMLNKLKALLATEEAGSERLTEIKPDQQVAVCAILLEVAQADQDFDPKERETIVHVLKEKFELGADEVEQLIELTQAERSRHPDLWVFTNAIGRAYSPEEKYAVMVMVWQVVFADQVLDAHEDMLVRKLQLMLAVNHSVVIKAKTEARQNHPLQGGA